jgi:hypothetical protein
MRFGEAVRPEGEAPHGDPLGTAGTDRSTGPVHIRLNKQQQIRQGNKRSASASPGGRSWNGPPASTGLTAPLARIWVCPMPALSHIQVHADERPPDAEDPLLELDHCARTGRRSGI